MGYAMLVSFATKEEAEAYKMALIDYDLYEHERIFIFNDAKYEGQLTEKCKPWTVNIE